MRLDRNERTDRAASAPNPRRSGRTGPLDRPRTSSLPSSVDFDALHRSCKILHDRVDALWIVSDAASDSLHGLPAIGMKPVASDELLQSTLRSRAGSLELYRCAAERHETATSR